VSQLCSLVTHPTFYPPGLSCSRRMRAASDSQVPSRFASVQNMFSVRQEVDYVLWLAEMTHYTSLSIVYCL